MISKMTNQASPGPKESTRQTFNRVKKNIKEGFAVSSEVENTEGEIDPNIQKSVIVETSLESSDSNKVREKSLNLSLKTKFAKIMKSNDYNNFLEDLSNKYYAHELANVLISKEINTRLWLMNTNFKYLEKKVRDRIAKIIDNKLFVRLNEFLEGTENPVKHKNRRMIVEKICDEQSDQETVRDFWERMKTKVVDMENYDTKDGVAPYLLDYYPDSASSDRTKTDDKTNNDFYK